MASIYELCIATTAFRAKLRCGSSPKTEQNDFGIADSCFSAMTVLWLPSQKSATFSAVRSRDYPWGMVLIAQMNQRNEMLL